MREVFVDYNRVGHARRFRTRLFRSEREGLIVVGDTVELREARVAAFSDDSREAELEFVAYSER